MSNYSKPLLFYFRFAKTETLRPARIEDHHAGIKSSSSPSSASSSWPQSAVSRSGPLPKRCSTEALQPIRRSSAAAVLCRSGHLPKRRVAETHSRPTGPARRPNNGNSLACVFVTLRVAVERQPAMETKNATTSQVARCNVTTDTKANKAPHK